MAVPVNIKHDVKMTRTKLMHQVVNVKDSFCVTSFNIT